MILLELTANLMIISSEDFINAAKTMKSFVSLRDFLLKKTSEVVESIKQEAETEIKKFTECESRYSPIEKLCCTLVWTTRRLRQYMLYHPTWLISELDPLKYMMESTILNGRMTR